MSKLHIIGKIAEWEKYLSLNPLFGKAFAFLKRTDLAELPPGKQEIDGDRCWANVIDAALKPREECKLEAHRRYIDIQAPVTGPETIGIADMDAAALALPFDEENDYVLYDGPSEPVTLNPGEFAIFMPSGAHAPCGRAPDGPEKIRKVVVKVAARLAILAAVAFAAVAPQARADAPDPREAAIAETAAAYWRKGAAMQYDSSPLTIYDKNNFTNKGPLRMSDGAAPECATKDRTVYTVCTSFAMEVYRHAIGWDQGGWPKSVTFYVMTNVPPETVVFRQDNLKNPERRQSALSELREMLRPGDEVVMFAPEKWGHAMLYVGDVDGDGRADVIHSSGRKYRYSEGFDMLEIGGNIYRDDAEDLFFSRTSVMSLEAANSYFVIRPTKLPADRYPITAEAAARLAYPGLRIDRTVSGGCYGSAPKGGELTYTVEIRNCSPQPYPAVPVVERIPDGTGFVRAEGAGKFEDGKVLWVVDIPGGAIVRLRYAVKVLADKGARIVSRGGSVGGIPSNVLTTSVQGTELRFEDLVRLRAGGGWREKVERSGVQGAAFAEAVYREVFGMEVRVPDLERTMGALARGETPPGCVPGWFGGRKVRTDPHAERVFECRAEDLKPGDVIFCGSESPAAGPVSAYVWTGVEVLIPRDGKIAEPGDPEVAALLSKDWFFAWRPTLCGPAR